jgi:class 3 adenylate cyclase/HAMP domain-containing protein
MAAKGTFRSVVWLLALVVLVNLAALSLLRAYSSLNLWTDIASIPGLQTQKHSMVLAALLALAAPTIASALLLWPILRWLRRHRDDGEAVPLAVADSAANVPLRLAVISLLGWSLVTAHAVLRYASDIEKIPLGLGAHLVMRPLLAGLVAASATFFAADYICRTRVWPYLLLGTRIAGNPRLWRVRVSHRLLVLWFAIGLFPLAATALTTLAGVAGLDLGTHPVLGRLVSTVLLIATSACVVGAWLAWLVARSIGRPLEVLEAAMARIRSGELDTRLPVAATDETGALTEGFNLMAGRLSDSYTALETRNRELAEALDRVEFLEHVKRGLDRFVPDAVRRAIETNPAAPGLAKAAKDVTVLFLDIEGYSRLSEALPRPALNALVERYFSLFLASIRAEGGDINETAGDGLMIIFQAGQPEDHASAAVRAALAIREQTRVANRDAIAGHPSIVVNIGVSSGECDVGATRFHGPAGERWTFTASGTVTNLAARLGDRAKGGQILIAAETAARVRERFSLRSLGLVSLKNLSSPVEVWEVRSIRAASLSPSAVARA